MNIRFISLTEFRRDIIKLSKRKNVRYIVTNRDKAILKVEPVDEDELLLKKFGDQLDRGLKDFKEGTCISSEMLLKSLKL